MNHFCLNEVHQYLGRPMTDTYFCPEEWDGKSLPKIYDDKGRILATWQRGHNRFTVFINPLQSKIPLSSLEVFDAAGFKKVQFLSHLIY